VGETETMVLICSFHNELQQQETFNNKDANHSIKRKSTNTG